jgi:diguanylate cyclase (GGDEF)-like protein/PAS domain S-box-containing protein/putative nucleotidyltransferase with HDIG domain
MKRLNAVTRIALCLAILSVGALILADALGYVPNRATIVRRERQALCESIAISSSLLASRGEFETVLALVAQRNDDILSFGLRRNDGKLLVDIGDHAAGWGRGQRLEVGDRGTEPSDLRSLASDLPSTDTHVFVPILAGDRQWGAVEVHFVPPGPRFWLSSFGFSFNGLLAVAGVINFLLFYLFLRRVLQHLDPNKVVPDRVRGALDSLAEGLVLMDTTERIVLANEAFAQALGVAPHELQGRVVSELPWSQPGDDSTPDRLPWRETLAGNESPRGEALGLTLAKGQRRVFMCNSSAILDDRGARRGVVASFDDITLLEAKKNELLETVAALQKSQEDIHRQNAELERLATRDALTGCLNRRAFFEHFQQQWTTAVRHELPLSSIMVDVDHFKAVNDNHGHAAGDEVLRKVSAALMDVARDTDFVARYGGEEFCFLLTHTDIDAAEECADRLRHTIEKLDLGELSITASLGVSSLSLGAETSQEMLDQADQCLYAAKRGGRNRVVRWDRMPSDFDMQQVIEEVRYSRPATDTTMATRSIPFNAVSALLSALAYRDASTAAHCTRVADLCSATARGLMSVADAYLLEVASLLHDIGKIGVPDSILLKPAPLSDDEWSVIRLHDRIGVEIIDSSFACPELTNMVKNYHFKFSGDPDNPKAPKGKEIPLAARILAIADAYDSMTSDAVYRRQRTRQEAFHELVKCAGEQFDPELVERFIEVMVRRGKLPHVPEETPQVSKQVALTIGVEVERIAKAVDARDLNRLSSLVVRLEATAAKNGLGDISAQAHELAEMVAAEPELADLLAKTHELLDICRTTQQAYLRVEDDMARTALVDD